MTSLEKINGEFADLQNCSCDQAGKFFGIIAVSFTQLSRNDQHEFAQRYLRWAEENCKSSPGNEAKFDYAKLLSGLDYFLSDHHEVALKELNEALKLLEEHQDKEGTGICKVVTAGIYRTLGDFDLALKTSWEGYELLKTSENFKHFHLAGLMNTANIYFEMKNNEEALRLFTLAYEESEKVSNTYWINYALHGLGKANLHEKKFNEAREFFEKALVLSEKVDSPLGIANSLTELAVYYYQTGSYEQAEKLHQRAIVIREEHHFKGGAVTNYIRLAEVYIKELRLEEALNILGKALTLAEEIGVKPKMYQIHFMLSEIYQHKQEFDQSLEHYKKFHTLREQVEVEDSERKLRNAKTIFEAEQTRKENIIIKKQKAEIERKNVELQETIDELTLARVGKKARAFTLAIAIVFFIIDDYILGSALHLLPADNYFESLAVKMFIIFSLRPINGAIEKFLLKKVLRDKKRAKELIASQAAIATNDVSTA